MGKIKIFYLVLILFSYLTLSETEGQIKPHGDVSEVRSGLHSGNQIKTTFYNTGFFGRKVDNPNDFGGEWPKNSGHVYVGDACTIVGTIIDSLGANGQPIIITPDGPLKGIGSPRRGEIGPNGEWFTWMPLPGYANPDSQDVAMTDLNASPEFKASWPSFWPDKMDDMVDPGWRNDDEDGDPDKAAWNGYFGKNVFNADQESFYVMDDYNDAEYPFYPDSTDTTRRGLGLKAVVRGFQWSNALVEDAIFWLFDITNIGTTHYDKMVFGMMIGNMLGNTRTIEGDFHDDSAEYDLLEDLAISYDFDGIGSGGWGPVGVLGYAFLESPGNPYDGIDNDGDGLNYGGPTISEDMFAPRSYSVGEQIVLIDYETYERTVTTMPGEGISFQYKDQIISVSPGETVREIANDNIDNNLNGIIDENNGAIIGTPPDTTQVYLYVGLPYKDYIMGTGLDNLLIDERRDDGIDNDGDWDFMADDVGLDGKIGTGDTGEGDGVPTSGQGTDLPGEPHIDKTDIDESDMIGLTSLYIFYPFDAIPLYDDNKIWKYMQPGYLKSEVIENKDADFQFGSGYFPLKVGQTERFSIAMIFGDGPRHDKNSDLYRNKEWVTKAYNENYNFAKAPYMPQLVAVPGDNKVTLYWDSIAEESEDPITGKDFEGYRIYRSTDTQFRDLTQITDAFGSETFMEPIAQFDLINEYQGFTYTHRNPDNSTTDYQVIPVKGVQFYLGDNTGLQHTFVDTDVKNGYTYYYAITSYDHGDPRPDKEIPPTECSIQISIDAAGNISKSRNVAIVRPEAPSAGYVPADIDTIEAVSILKPSGYFTYRIIDPAMVKDNHRYRITFEDTIRAGSVAEGDTLSTKSWTLADVTYEDQGVIDTLIDQSQKLSLYDEQPIVDGFQLMIHNTKYIAIDRSRSHWNRDSLYTISFKVFKYGFVTGTMYPSDYLIIFDEVGVDTSTYFQVRRVDLNPKPVNFRVYNLSTSRFIDFAFWETHGDDGVFSADYNDQDLIILMERDENDSLIVTWEFKVVYDERLNAPTAGDTAFVYLSKPFLSSMMLEFTTHRESIDEEKAKSQMDNIRVVPNPYIVTNSWEPLNPYSSGHGPRHLHFINLPPKCTIRIFNVRGQLVDTIEHEAITMGPEMNIWDGTEIWDMLTRDNLDIAYGVYIYHIDAGKYGQKVGKFCVIK